MNTAWVLLLDYDNYDPRSGMRFVAWFPTKPSREDLIEVGVPAEVVDEVLEDLDPLHRNCTDCGDDSHTYFLKEEVAGQRSVYLD